jgi:hypothetical protein
MMLDTVSVGFPLSVDNADLEIWDKKTTDEAGGKRYSKYIRNVELDNRAKIKFCYFPVSFTRFPHLLVEMSIPNVINGNNIEPIFDLNYINSFLNETLDSIPGVPHLDISEGVLSRIDVFYNHQCDDLVPYYIKALQSLEYSHRRTLPYTRQGVRYCSKQVTTKFYDKELECGNSAAKGILRQETSMRKKAILRYIGIKKPTLFDLNSDNLSEILEKDLQRLKIFNCSIGTVNTLPLRLCQEYGEYAGLYHLGLLMLQEEMNKEYLPSVIGVHPRTLDRRIKNFVDAGIPPTITNAKEPLPPLTIDREIMMKQDIYVSESTK